MKTVRSYLPGCALALVIAAAAKLLERLENAAGLQLIGASVIALFIGMLVNCFYPPNAATKPGIRFTSKKILKFAIILLGASLNIRTVLTVGRFSLTVMVFTLATCFGLGALIGKALGLNWKTSSLINAGTGICGGSAIAAIAPVIDATDLDIAYGMSATFLFDMVMILVFPQGIHGKENFSANLPATFNLQFVIDRAAGFADGFAERGDGHVPRVVFVAAKRVQIVKIGDQAGIIRVAGLAAAVDLHMADLGDHAVQRLQAGQEFFTVFLFALAEFPHYDMSDHSLFSFYSLIRYSKFSKISTMPSQMPSGSSASATFVHVPLSSFFRTA